MQPQSICALLLKLSFFSTLLLALEVAEVQLCQDRTLVKLQDTVTYIKKIPPFFFGRVSF